MGAQEDRMVVFSKMIQDGDGEGAIDFSRDGERVGHIEKRSEATWVGSSRSWAYRVDEYEAIIYDGDDRLFQVDDYPTPRAALAAAKHWVRESLTQ